MLGWRLRGRGVGKTGFTTDYTEEHGSISNPENPYRSLTRTGADRKLNWPAPLCRLAAGFTGRLRSRRLNDTGAAQTITAVSLLTLPSPTWPDCAAGPHRIPCGRRYGRPEAAAALLPESAEAARALRERRAHGRPLL